MKKRQEIGLAEIDTHPVAALFPLMSDEELKDLAADIAERGLIQPIVLDKQERILDGRNRFHACQMAGVQASYVTYEGDDPDGYAVTVNINRRHMSKGQQALVIARANRVARNLPNRQLADQHGMSRERINQANVIIDCAPYLADKVLASTGFSQKARRAIAAARRPGTTEPEGQLKFDGLDSYDYEPRRLVLGADRDIIENEKAKPQHKAAEANAHYGKR